MTDTIRILENLYSYVIEMGRKHEESALRAEARGKTPMAETERARSETASEIAQAVSFLIANEKHLAGLEKDEGYE